MCVCVWLYPGLPDSCSKIPNFQAAYPVELNIVRVRTHTPRSSNITYLHYLTRTAVHAEEFGMTRCLLLMTPHLLLVVIVTS